MEEIFEICDVVTVLKDGKKIDTVPVAQTNEDELVAKMVEAFPSFAAANEKPETGALDTGAIGTAGDVGDIGFASPVTDFYLTNPIARASETMAECSAVFVHGQQSSEVTGTNG